MTVGRLLGRSETMGEISRIKGENLFSLSVCVCVCFYGISALNEGIVIFLLLGLFAERL